MEMARISLEKPNNPKYNQANSVLFRKPSNYVNPKTAYTGTDGDSSVLPHKCPILFHIREIPITGWKTKTNIVP